MWGEKKPHEGRQQVRSKYESHNVHMKKDDIFDPSWQLALLFGLNGQWIFDTHLPADNCNNHYFLSTLTYLYQVWLKENEDHLKVQS